MSPSRSPAWCGRNQKGREDEMTTNRLTIRAVAFWLLMLLTCALPIPVLAQESPAAVPAVDSGDTAWMLASAGLVACS